MAGWLWRDALADSETLGERGAFLEDLESAQERAETRGTVANVLLATGGVAVATGVVLWLLDEPSEASASWPPPTTPRSLTVTGSP